jgi:hypothetical protein
LVCQKFYLPRLLSRFSVGLFNKLTPGELNEKKKKPKNPFGAEQNN